METIFIVWVGMALTALLSVTLFLQASFPLFTVVWLVVPLLAFARTHNAQQVGFQRISWRNFVSTTAINLTGLILVSVLVEPWSHAYQALVTKALLGTPPDITFAWLVRFTGLAAWVGLFLYGGLVTIFGEELFFRGWLLQSLQHRMSRGWAVIIQSALFTIPQLLAAFLMDPVTGLAYAVMYSWLAVGIIGGWAAVHTQSIWPSLTSATIWNIIIVAWVLRGG